MKLKLYKAIFPTLLFGNVFKLSSLKSNAVLVRGEPSLSTNSRLRGTGVCNSTK